MIRIETVHIEEFRGVRILDLNLNKENFGICGPNGTGKSGVVDAIEFCLTGDVSRLSGQGSTGLSVKAHAPHVDQKNRPEKAIVSVTAYIPSLEKSVKLRRSVKNPRFLEISPNEPTIRSVIEELQTHPEFALSRRDITKYIVTPPGRRSEDVQTLLRLDHIEKLRKSFTSSSNRYQGEADEAERAYSRAETDLKNALKIDKLDRALVLTKVNEKREVLGLQAYTELTKGVSFKAGVVVPKVKPGDKKPIVKAVALSELTALKSAIEAGEPAKLSESRKSARKILTQLAEDAKALILARRHGFVATGLDLVTEDSCPLCDSSWKADELREHLRKKLLSGEKIKKLLDELKTSTKVVLQEMSTRIQSIERTVVYAGSLTPPIDQTDLNAYLKELKSAERGLADFVRDHHNAKEAADSVSAEWWALREPGKARIDECLTAVKALPDTTAEDEARDFLIIAQERYEKVLEAAAIRKQQKTRSAVTQKALELYNANCKRVLEGIYDKVAEDFTNYYRVINRDDEEGFVGKLTSAPAKLSFDVDFYGRGLSPPGAYHSEGHQDGMGLCLYLALMKHTLADKFTFAVLDDVLMSVDTGHRREVCRLLKSEFPKTQFILTTHDRVWLQYMKTEGLIVRSQSFGGWSVDSGPRVWNDQDIWTEIENELKKNDVAKAAWLLRRYLEYTATILADNLRVRIEYRGDGHYDLGDLLPHVLKKWEKTLEDGEKSARAWGREDQKTALAADRVKAKDLIVKSKTEEWAINPSVHFNEWANLQAREFGEVVNAFKELLQHLRCGNATCQSYLYILPRKGSSEEMRCNCGSTSINLKGRS